MTACANTNGECIDWTGGCQWNTRYRDVRKARGIIKPDRGGLIIEEADNENYYGRESCDCALLQLKTKRGRDYVHMPKKKRLHCGKVTACSAALQQSRTGSGGATHQSDRKTRPRFLSADLPEGCFLSSPAWQRRGRLGKKLMPISNLYHSG